MTTPATRPGEREGEEGRVSTRKPATMKAGSPDDFQTDPWVLEALYPWIDEDHVIWESACGEGLLAGAMASHGYSVVHSDILTARDFFEWQPERWDVQVTNPPYRPKDAWLARSYALGKPFALLLPLITLEGVKRQDLFRRHGVEVICLPKRPTFTTPVQKKSGGSWFACMWVTHGLGIGQALTFWDGGKCVPASQPSLALEAHG